MGTLRKTYPHGYLRYAHNRCRCDVCRTDATRKRNREWFRNTHGDGPAMVDSAQSQREVRMLSRAGLSLSEMRRRSGVSVPTFGRLYRAECPIVRSTTRDRVHLLWQDVFGEHGELYDPAHPYRLRKGSGKRGPALWPRQTLRDKVIERSRLSGRDGVMSELENRRLTSGDQEMWSTQRADRVSVELGFLPWEVWDGWSDRTERKSDVGANS